MESWNYFSEEKAFVSDEHETVSPSDYIGRSGRNGVMNWELRTPPSFVNAVAVSGQEADAGQAFGQFGFQELIRKQVPSNSPEHGLSDKFGVAKDTTPIMATLNAYHGEDESTSHFSTSGTQDSLLIDLKLGRFAETREATCAKLPQGTMMLSSSESSTPPKRARSSGVNCHIAYCQVYGCNKDLSSSKDYHKRHKVCEVHSKTSKVIVNGIEQRFCQQCSRFHLLGEFDDGKRSCRKRLTVHNERRRKPQVSVQSGNVGRLLQSYNGNGFARNMLAPTSFMCQDILSGGFMNPEKYGMNNCYERIKAENGNDFGPPSAISIPNKQLNSKPLVSPYNYERQFPLFSEGGINCMSSGIVNKSSQIQHELGGPNSSHSSFQDNSLGSEDFTVFDTASTVPRISGIMESGRALSLLSSRTQNSSSHSSGIPVAHSLVVPVAPSLCEMPDKLVGVSSHASLAVVSNRLSSSATDSAEGNYPGHALISEFEISDGILRGSHLVNCEDNLSCEDGTTMNLLQLSSQLQRVEDQRQSAHVKQENDVFSCPRIN